jgi:hypothetical protein
MSSVPDILRRFFQNDGAGDLLRPEIIPPTAGSLRVGDMAMSPFRAADLAGGWRLMNGDRYPLASPEGLALQGLPSNFKLDWRIEVVSQTINVPDWFDPETGRGYLQRAADGTERAVGSVQLDAGRRVSGNVGHEALHPELADGSFREYNNYGGRVYNNGGIRDGQVDCDSGRQWGEEHVADEFRPLNVGMSPVIYLGVWR